MLSDGECNVILTSALVPAQDAIAKDLALRVYGFANLLGICASTHGVDVHLVDLRQTV